MNFDAFKTELNIRTGDTDNFTFTNEEKTAALTEAFNDESVVGEVWSTPLTFDSSTYQYAKPNGVSSIKDIYIKAANSNDFFPNPISSSVWSVVGSNIQFTQGVHAFVVDGTPLYLKGVYKYTVADTIDNVNTQEYILNIAQLHLYTMLGTKKTFRFLKNDTSVSEIVTMKRELERKVADYKRRLPRSFEGA